ncbi:hypothetical protein [Aurantiacibacter aquimixticola]|uniref:Uncharacterized protein n=1 Tax=Aurantiacibacter aquimixticola TaxID=1958945 RepID=A0A419RSC4_9SPHN|nr:hypothetical protein [Aurantiacibacter aquimixticola]RJY08676.1 hypothetical protein D6201_04255 [Aurantiacibacter aquimixticola]
MKRALRSSAAAATVLSLLAACASAPPIQRPVTSYAPVAACPETPSFANAVSVVPEKDKAVWLVDHQLDSTSPCLTMSGVSGPYAVFALPETRWNAPIEVGSVVGPAALFSPHVEILGADGSQMRSFTPEHYNMRSHMSGRTYSVQFMPQDGERYVLVTSNPARIGSAIEGIATSTVTNTMWYGYGAANWTSGVEAQLASAFSYEGPVRVNVFRQPKED